MCQIQSVFRSTSKSSEPVKLFAELQELCGDIRISQDLAGRDVFRGKHDLRIIVVGGRVPSRGIAERLVVRVGAFARPELFHLARVLREYNSESTHLRRF